MLFISRVILKNWRNFQSVDVPMGKRVFLVGPNACGKSNFLDVFRFLRDIAKQENGGLQSAVNSRGGLSKIRFLPARRSPNVEIEVHLSDISTNEVLWKYAVGIRKETPRHRQALLSHERIWQKDRLVVDRLDKDDRQDQHRLTQTHLEQTFANREFRDIASFFESISYLHIVPQFIRHPEAFSGPGIPEDPFGQGFMERVARTSENTRKTRLKKIEEALRIAVPNLKKLTDTKDEMGIPHLEAIYEHWRPNNAGKQREDQFSDGTLRLIGFLWSLLEGDALLLMEEPELSLNSAIVSRLPGIMFRIQSQRKKKRQVIISTHSPDLLSDTGIGGEEILLMRPEKEGTSVTLSSSIEDIRLLLEGGMSVADAVLPQTAPPKIRQLELFK